MLRQAQLFVHRRRRRRRMAVVAGLLAALVGMAVAFGVSMSGPRYRGPVSDHFDGDRFFDVGAPKRAGVSDVVKWVTHRHPGTWQSWTEAPPGPPPPTRVVDGRLHVTFINHATTLVQMDGLNILTDPIWSDRCSPVGFAGPRRVRPPGIRFEDLPPIDAVIISHSHYDHLDIPTLQRLAAIHHPRFFVGLGVRPLLEKAGLEKVTELDWWQEEALANDFQVVSVPTQHFANRGLADQDATLWTGYALRGPSGTVFFAGDTGFGPKFEEIRRRLGPVRLAILPIGAYKPEWFMGRIHMSPKQAVEAHRILGAGTSVAIHFGTFRLADDGQTEAPDELRKELASQGSQAPRFWVLDFGEGRDVPPLDLTRPTILR